LTTALLPGTPVLGVVADRRSTAPTPSASELVTQPASASTSTAAAVRGPHADRPGVQAPQ